MTSLVSPQYETAPAHAKLPQLEPINLLVDLDELLDWLAFTVDSGDWLDAFLVAAGIQQLIDDHTTPMRAIARRAGTYLMDSPVETLRRAGVIAVASDWALAGLPASSARAKALAALSRSVGSYLLSLAPVLLESDGGPDLDARMLRAQGDQLVTALRPIVRDFENEIVRLPSSFRSFDQRPVDVATLTSKFADAFEPRDRPICVVGVRSSGSYLAPLCAAALGSAGFSDVATVTVRPSWPLDHATRAVLARAARKGGRILLLDDPPASGRSLERVVDDFADRLRIKPESIVLLLGLLSNEIALGGNLTKTTLITLPFEQWDCHRSLEPAALCESLNALLQGVSSVVSAKASPVVHDVQREHVERSFTVELRNASTGEITSAEIVAEGVGSGYFGRHALAVAKRMPHLVPEVIGLADGFIYRHAVAQTDLIAATRPDAVQLIARHVSGRKHALRVNTDPSIHLAGRQPAWEIAASVVGRALGPLALPLRGLVVAPIVRRNLAVAEPSVSDCMTASDSWFAPPGRTAAVKTNFAEGPFSHLDLASFDAAFDLAGVALAADDEGFSARLRTEFENGDSPIAPERWLLLQLVHSWNERRLGHVTGADAARRGARLVHCYFAERFITDLSPAIDGPWCAIDLDGVLETSPLGFPATTAAGARAMRTLVAHGYRILLASGRSLAELTERCTIYEFPAAVAEYGSVIYDRAHDMTIDLISSGEAAELACLRATARGADDLVVDEDYERIVRVYCIDARGRRRAPDSERSAALRRACSRPELIAVIEGEDQTDFVAVSVDKAKAIRILLSQFHEMPSTASGGADESLPLAFAIGDSATDASFLELAHAAFAPANASATLDEIGVQRVRGSYQAGIAAAVGRLVGHRPGGCAICRAPHIDFPGSLLVDLLSVQEGGVGTAPLRIARLVLRMLIGTKPR